MFCCHMTDKCVRKFTNFVRGFRFPRLKIRTLKMATSLLLTRRIHHYEAVFFLKRNFYWSCNLERLLILITQLMLIFMTAVYLQWQLGVCKNWMIINRETTMKIYNWLREIITFGINNLIYLYYKNGVSGMKKNEIEILAHYGADLYIIRK